MNNVENRGFLSEANDQRKVVSHHQKACILGQCAFEVTCFAPFAIKGLILALEKGATYYAAAQMGSLGLLIVTTIATSAHVMRLYKTPNPSSCIHLKARIRWMNPLSGGITSLVLGVLGHPILALTTAALTIASLWYSYVQSRRLNADPNPTAIPQQSMVVPPVKEEEVTLSTSSAQSSHAIPSQTESSGTPTSPQQEITNPMPANTVKKTTTPVITTRRSARRIPVQSPPPIVRSNANDTKPPSNKKQVQPQTSTSPSSQSLTTPNVSKEELVNLAKKVNIHFEKDCAYLVHFTEDTIELERSTLPPKMHLNPTPSPVDIYYLKINGEIFYRIGGLVSPLRMINSKRVIFIVESGEKKGEYRLKLDHDGKISRGILTLSEHTEVKNLQFDSEPLHTSFLFVPNFGLISNLSSVVVGTAPRTKGSLDFFINDIKIDQFVNQLNGNRKGLQKILIENGPQEGSFTITQLATDDQPTEKWIAELVSSGNDTFYQMSIIDKG